MKQQKDTRWESDILYVVVTHEKPKHEENDAVRFQINADEAILSFSFNNQ